MQSTTAIMSTEFASKYLQQLCKHFGHKVPVEFTPEAGLIKLPFGSCDLTADETSLKITATSEADKLNKMQSVIEDHLKRFAFREEFELDWQSAA